MSHSAFAIAGLYDHEQEAVLDKERRAPDWGGDELFTSTPRRRFARGSHTPDRTDSPRLRETTEHPLPSRRSGYAVEPAPVAEIGQIAEEAPAPAPEPDPYAQPVPAGRRTVTVTGRPGALALRPRRPLDAPARRPGRTLDERIGARPDRVAALAFGLGLLLIVIAIATAHG